MYVFLFFFFFKENPKSGVNVLSSTLAAALPPPTPRSERFSGDTAVSFSQALLELGHGPAGREEEGGRSLRRGKKRREEREKRKISRGPGRQEFCLLVCFSVFPPHPDNTQIDMG